jgi:hypothetical protein
MMFGGAIMMFFGLVALLLVIAVPIVLIVLLVQRQAGPNNPAVSTVPPVASTGIPLGVCSHCGQSLQAGWTHCPQCGAPTK